MAITIRIDNVAAGNKQNEKVVYVTAMDGEEKIYTGCVTYTTDTAVMKQRVIDALKPAVVKHLAMKNIRTAAQNLCATIDLES